MSRGSVPSRTNAHSAQLREGARLIDVSTNSNPLASCIILEMPPTAHHGLRPSNDNAGCSRFGDSAGLVHFLESEAKWVPYGANRSIAIVTFKARLFSPPPQEKSTRHEIQSRIFVMVAPLHGF